MSFAQTEWTTGDVITEVKMDNGEEQYDQALFHAGHIQLGGDGVSVLTGSSYPSGATADKLIPHSSIINRDPAEFTGTWVLEGMAHVLSAGQQVRIALFNLSDAADTVLTGSEVIGTSGNLTGERLRSGAITFTGGGSAKNMGAKMRGTAAADDYLAWGLRLLRTA